MTMQRGEIFSDILKIFSDPNTLDGIGYNIQYRVIKALEFGVPQKRERLVIMGVRRKDFNLDKLIDLTKAKIRAQYPAYFDRVTVRDAIGNLPKVTESGEIKNPEPQTD